MDEVIEQLRLIGNNVGESAATSQGIINFRVIEIQV